MNAPIFSRKGDAVPSVTDDQQRRAAEFADRRIIRMSDFTGGEPLSYRVYSPAPPIQDAVSGHEMVHGTRHPDRRKFSLRMDLELHDRFQRALKAKGTSGQKLLIGLLRTYLDEFEKSYEEAGDEQ